MSKMITFIPKIRFKDYLNDWPYTELKEVKDVRDGTHSSPKYVDNGYPLVTSKNLTDSGLNLDDVSLISELDYNEINKRSKVEVGDILLGLIGTIGKPVLVETEGFAIKNVGLIKNGGQIQNQFLLQYLKTNLFNKYIQIEMAGNTQKFLGLETLRNTKVPVPSPEEQSAIGFLFRNLDDLLASYKDNLANYQSLKATMLFKMFPKAGQTVPEIRLDGFEGEWEKGTIGEFGSFYYGKSAPKWSVTDEATTPCVRYGELYTKFSTKIDEIYSYTSIPKENLKLSSGNEVLVPRVGEDPLDFANCSWLSLKGVAIGEMISVYNTPNNPLFIAYYFNAKMKKEFAKRVEGGSVANLYYTYLENISISVPSLPEQQAIGAYFSNLDNLINSYQEKISQLEILKKKLLQEMFI
ncbi:restriction endonuclease subunit S [Peptoniphilus lacrimalis DNF00528]|nr:restriction endonuclease subunit S [Peptoniphilus lacrimalis DNF00528]